MRIIARRTLREFIAERAGHKDQPALKAALDAWFAEMAKAAWTSTADVKRLYATASIVSADRIVFNINGNDYRSSLPWISRRPSYGSSGSAPTRTMTVST
jgi:mRNA interferase HigB